MSETCYWPTTREVTVSQGARSWREVERIWASAGWWHGRPIQIDHDSQDVVGPYAVFPICDQHDLFADTIWGTISGFITCDGCRGTGWGPSVGDDWADGELQATPGEDAAPNQTVFLQVVASRGEQCQQVEALGSA